MPPEYRTKKTSWETGSVERATADGDLEAVAAAALTVIRRVLMEGARLTRATLEHEASVHLRVPRADAARELDAVAQRLGVSGLT